jgi:hypothetical protein
VLPHQWNEKKTIETNVCTPPCHCRSVAAHWIGHLLDIGLSETRASALQ